MDILKKLKQNYVSSVLVTLYSILPVLLYYWTGEMKFIVEPVDHLFNGMYALVFLVFGLVGLLLSTLIEVNIKWRGL